MWGKEGQKDKIKEWWVICHSQYDELKILPLHWMHYRCVWACAYMRDSKKTEEEKSAVLGWMDGSINVIEIALQHITGCINIKENISIHHAFTLPLFDQSLSKTWLYFYTYIPNFWKQRLLSIRARKSISAEVNHRYRCWDDRNRGEIDDTWVWVLWLDGDQHNRPTIRSLGVEGRTRGRSTFSFALLKRSVTMAVVRLQQVSML